MSSIFHRSAISAIANFGKLLCTFATGIILAKGLGPEDYGIFSFLIASFMGIHNLMDFGSSQAFFSFISKRNRSINFFVYYWIWLLLRFSLTLTVVSFLLPNSWFQFIWEGESKQRVFWALITVFFQQQIWDTINYIGESQRLTIQVQLTSFLTSLFLMLSIVGFYRFGSISIELVYKLTAFKFITATCVSYFILPIHYSSKNEKLINIAYEYYIYCLPLFFYGLLGAARDFADTWMLQRYSGASEQSYYALAKQFSVASVILTKSVRGILFKEVARAHELDLKSRSKFLYERINRILFFCTIALSGYLIPWREDIIHFFLGSEYKMMSFPMALMLIFPINICLGQVVATLYYALEATRAYVKISIITMIVSLIAVYFLLAPPDSVIPGLGLGATGVALKMVVIHFISSNVCIWWLMREFGWTFDINYQIIGLIFFITGGFIVHFCVKLTLGNLLSTPVKMGISGFLYGLGTLYFFYAFPRILTFSKVERDAFLVLVRRLITNRLFGSRPKH